MDLGNYSEWLKVAGAVIKAPRDAVQSRRSMSGYYRRVQASVQFVEVGAMIYFDLY
jgi:hypothetical protein